MAGSIMLLPVRLVVAIAVLVAQFFVFLWAMYTAWDIRMYPIRDFGMIIHEFDPWFNYRAAEFYCEHGAAKFFKWYDYMSWYPIGRPIGTTTYPGMQMTACWIRDAMAQVPAFTSELPSSPLVKLARTSLKSLSKGGWRVPELPSKFEYEPMSVNDICCMIGPWFGSLASFFTGMLTYEITRSRNAAVVAMGIMAIMPAHLMRSIGGKYDNEAVAMTAIVSTFWLWLRSVRTPKSWLYGVLGGISYIYMVLSWGGYIFVINMIGVHALVLVGLGRFNSGVYRAYTLFYIIGTAGAIQVPVVGLQPIRSLEQIGPLLVFLGYQVLGFCDIVRWKRNMSTREFVTFRLGLFASFLAALVVVCLMLYPMGYFGPLSSRIRGLFVKHTKTGNPLVDSVAEHRPANADAYERQLGWPLSFAMPALLVCAYRRTNGCYFAFVYAFVAAHFSGKMSRLILICAPICSVGAGVWLGFLLDHMLEPVLLLLGKQGYSDPEAEGADGGASTKKKEAPASGGGDKKGKKATGGKAAKSSGGPDWTSAPLQEFEEEHRPGGMAMIIGHIRVALAGLVPEEKVTKFRKGRANIDRDSSSLFIRLALSGFLASMLLALRPGFSAYFKYCHQHARALSNTKIVVWANDRQGNRVKMDDYLRGYEWIKENTPADARVIAWWDYGYQITGIANRTSIADGNTWNHEHIATLGRTLTSSEKRAHNAIRHWADYLLVWAGGQGDDLAKSPHLARIGNSVFPDHCGDDDPKCTKFSFYQDGTPTKMMAASLLYKAVKHKLAPGVELDPRYFQEVHTTKHGKMRVFKVMNVSQESKDWIDDPKNRVCDAPGSWYCVGQFPPALNGLIAKRRNFAQLEDFNNKANQKSAYSKMVEQERDGVPSKNKKREL